MYLKSQNIIETKTQPSIRPAVLTTVLDRQHARAQPTQRLCAARGLGDGWERLVYISYSLFRG